VRHIT